jgi:hypothetical protein
VDEASEQKLRTFINWLGRLHLSVYNLMDGYPALGLENQPEIFAPQAHPDKKWLVLTPVSILILVVYMVVVMPFITVFFIVAFWTVLLLGIYPEQHYIWQIKHLEMVLKLASKMLIGR